MRVLCVLLIFAAVGMILILIITFLILVFHSNRMLVYYLI